MERILVIKIGASGDVVRTTPLLHVLEGEVTWVTAPLNVALLPAAHPKLARILTLEEAQKALLGVHFDRVICLEDDGACAALGSSVQTENYFGVYIKNGEVTYTEDARPWFDMGLVSRFGLAKADEIKAQNRETYQAILFKMLGYSFENQPYILPNLGDVKRKPKRIGIESRAGKRWPTKIWTDYNSLAENLEEKGFEVFFFQDREHILDYARDIASCSVFVGGDTLGMHLAMATQTSGVALFTCTSPWEIHDYGLFKKITSPKLMEAFYKTDYFPEVVQAISLAEVEEAVLQQINAKTV